MRSMSPIPQFLRKGLSVGPLMFHLATMGRKESAEVVSFVCENNVIGALQVKGELSRLAEIIAERRPMRILEIGTARGGTLCLLSKLAAPNATIISADLPGGEFGGGYAWFYIPIFKMFVRQPQKLHLIRGDSHSAEVQSAVRDVLGREKLDLLFIDGDHSYTGVKQDFENYMPMVARGGVIALHDIAEHVDQTCEVARFWNELKSQYQTEEIIEDRQQGWAGIGVVYV